MKKKSRLLQSDIFWGMGAALLVLLQFWWLPGEDGSAADSYSTTVDGKLGLYRTLSQLFPRVDRDALNVVPRDSATLILVAPDRYPNEKEQQELYEFVYNGGSLLFAPNWLSPEPSDENSIPQRVTISSLGIDLSYRPVNSSVVMTVPTPVATSPVATSPVATSPVATSPVGTPVTPMIPPVVDSSVPPGPAGGTSSPGTPAVEKENIGTEIVATSGLVEGNVDFRSTAILHLPGHLTTETLLTSATGDAEAAAWTMGLGRVVVCSSADLFSNRSMLYKASRRLAVRLVEKCTPDPENATASVTPSIVLSEYFNASDSYQNTGILFSPTLRIGTLQLLLVAILGIWMAFHRFGPAAEITTTQRRSLTESAQAVGNLQYRLRDGGTVVRSYLDYMNSQLRRRYGSFLRLDQSEHIANRSGMNVDEVRSQLQEAQRMSESAEMPAARVASMLRWLARLQQRLAGNRDAS